MISFLIRCVILTVLSVEAELAADVTALEQTRATLNTELIQAAQRSRTLEDRISNSEVRLDASLQTEEVIRLSLLKRRALLSEILATLPSAVPY